MNRLFLTLGSLVLVLSALFGSEAKNDDLTWDMEYLEKTWGLKFKSAKIDKKGMEAKILLEFTKDVKNLQEVTQAFDPKNTNGKLMFYFFDDENVAFAKVGLRTVEGEITGRAGEAFRVFIAAPDKKGKTFEQVKKISVRPELEKLEKSEKPEKNVTPKPLVTPLEKPAGPPVGMKFVWIEAGSFTMGSPPKEANRDEQEVQHKVAISSGFYMSAYPVTQGQWEAIMGNNPSHFKGDKNLPVESVSWDEVKDFVKKISMKDKREYRLPTEAEWEYCARAGTMTAYSTGDKLTAEQANFKEAEGGRKKTTPVGSFKPNPWGLYDMHGNVYQWCEDWYGDYPKSAVTDPEGPMKGKYRVLRGGAWDYAVQYCRSANRNWESPEAKHPHIGCRLCYDK